VGCPILPVHIPVCGWVECECAMIQLIYPRRRLFVYSDILFHYNIQQRIDPVSVLVLFNCFQIRVLSMNMPNDSHGVLYPPPRLPPPPLPPPPPSATTETATSTVPLATIIHSKPTRTNPQILHNKQQEYMSTSSGGGSINSEMSDTKALDVNSPSNSPPMRTSPPPLINNNRSPSGSRGNSRSPPRSHIDTTQMPRPRPTKSSVHNPYVYHTSLFSTPVSPTKQANSSSHYLYHDSSLTPPEPAAVSPEEPVRKCPPMSTAEWVLLYWNWHHEILYIILY
jgi:hypothetical protein